MTLRLSLAVVLLTAFMVQERKSDAQDQTAALKNQVIAEIDSLKKAVTGKINNDIASTSIAFTQAESISRSLRIAYSFRAPLNIISGTLSTMAAVKSLNNVGSLFQRQDLALGMAAVWLALQNAKQVGNDLQFVIDGPAYADSVQRMITDARATQPRVASVSVASFDDRAYRKVIENWLNGSQGNLVLRIDPVNFSLACEDRNDSAVLGIQALKIRLNNKFREIESRISGGNYSREQLLDIQNQIRYVRRIIIESKSGITRSYRSYQRSASGKCSIAEHAVALGEVSSYQSMLSRAYDALNRGLRVEQTITITTAAGAIIKTVTLRYNGKAPETIKNVSRLMGYEKLGEFFYTKTFTGNGRDQIMTIPQQMLMALPGEMSAVWALILDLNYYIGMVGAGNTVSAVSGSGNTIRRIDFGNFTYQLPNIQESRLGSVRLRNGEYNGGNLRDGMVNCKLYKIAYGDLTGDGREEAIIVLIFDLGGSAFWMDGQVFTINGVRPVLLAKFDAGDRGRGSVKDLTVKNGILIVDYDVPGYGDPSCCPSNYQIVQFKWDGRRFVEIAKSPVRKRR